MRPTLGIAPDDTVFFYAFDYRSYIARKNPLALIEAFREAFPTEAGVRLLIKTQGAAQAPAAAQALRERVDDPRITLWDATLDRAEMLALVADSDCYVSLHRSEGFGRGPAEAMLLGKPVILTDYSGTRDFADATCALPVGWQKVAVPPGTYPGAEEQHWADPSVSDAARAMRWVAAHPSEAAALGRQARKRIESLYAPAVAGEAILRALGLAHGRDQRAQAAE
jgi:glycosyltransferase involved in cell wall biosynthesis